MKNIKFYIIFLSISILFLLFDWYYSRKLNLDYIKMIIFSLTIVFAYQLLRNKFLNAQFKKIVALSNLIQRRYHNDIHNMLP